MMSPIPHLSCAHVHTSTDKASVLTTVLLLLQSDLHCALYTRIMTSFTPHR